jgi:MFS family permease
VAELGLALAVLNVVTMVCQPPIGFLVDRVGPAWILIAGHMAFAVAIGLVGVWPTFPALLALMVLAGLGNAVYHPADYAILSHRISGSRIGRAFSIHTFGGYAGFAAAPIAVIGLTEVVGWRLALMLIGLAGVALGAGLVLNRHDLATHIRRERERPRVVQGNDRRLLWTVPVLLSLLFYILLGISNAGFSSFSVVVLERVYGMSLTEANLPITLFLLVSTVGVLVGGWIADRTDRHGIVVSASSLAMAVTSAVIAGITLSLPAMLVVFIVAGFASGLIAPSRDMLVRAVTPVGASGKVFGFVTIGFNVGGLVAPPVFGLLIDRGNPLMVFWIVAVVSAATIVTVMGTMGERRTTRPA